MANVSIPLIETLDISKHYGDVNGTWALRDVNMRVEQGEFVAIIGASGSGKSTLLNLIGALDKPTSGAVVINGKVTSRLDQEGLAALRGDTIGFIFQFHYLLNEFTVLENVLMPVELRKKRLSRDDISWAMGLLERVGLSDSLKKKPTQLSGGQQQRAAIVRAIANRPRLILADEPTGNLDTRNGALVFDMLRELNQEFDMGFVLVTHDERLAREADRIIAIEDGRIVADYAASEVRADTLGAPWIADVKKSTELVDAIL